MTVRRFIGFALLAFLGVAAAVQIWYGRSWFLTNRAVYLMNQRNWDAAGEQLTRVLDLEPDNSKARRLKAWVALNTARYREAESTLSGVPRSAEVAYDLGICAFQSGRNAEAASLFRSIPAIPGRLSSAQRQIAEAASAILAGLPTSGLGEKPQSSLDPVDAMLFAALRGREGMQMFLFEPARESLNRAIDLDDKSTETAFLAATANIVMGLYSKAREIVDQTDGQPAYYQALARNLSEIADSVATGTMTIDESAKKDLSLYSLRLGGLWCRLRSLDRATTNSDLLKLLSDVEGFQNRKDDVVLGLIRAETLEHLGRFPQAFEQYATLHARNPSYSLRLRMEALNPELALNKEGERGGGGLDPRSAWFFKTDFATTGGEIRSNYLAFFTNGEAAATYTCPADGNYILYVVARGDDAFGLWPLVEVTIDGQSAQNIYVAREGWDCYPLRAWLTKGTHLIKMKYVNNSVRLFSDAEDRNFYLRELVISPLGAN
ncbi:MAG: tetratricopeptide repeat protein [Candidatus Sumerlaeaceae bacterium]|nr:tetratricopeptide repeat protein [Candidatus Sumerlaeaceae bacterium]